MTKKVFAKNFANWGPLEADKGVVIYTKKSPDKGPSEMNEDSAALKTFKCGSVLLCVADGMGGYENGEVASRMVVESVCSIRSNPSIGKLLDKIQSAHIKIKGLKKLTGTTIVCALIKEDQLSMINIGDSRLVLMDKNGEEKMRSWDHSIGGFAIEAEVVKSSSQVKDGHLLLNALGVDFYRSEIVRDIPIQGKDRVLLCSDGITANLSEGKVSQLSELRPIEFSVGLDEQLEQSWQSGGHPDDSTAIMYYRQ